MADRDQAAACDHDWQEMDYDFVCPKCFARKPSAARTCEPCKITLRPDEKIGKRMGDGEGFFCSDPDCPIMPNRLIELVRAFVDAQEADSRAIDGLSDGVTFEEQAETCRVRDEAYEELKSYVTG